MPIKKKRLIALFLLLLIGAAMAFLSPVAAEDLWDRQTGLGDNGNIGDSFGDSGEPTDFRLVIANLVKVVLGFIGVIFLVLIIIAGYNWMTAGGNEDKVKTAKSQMANAVIGLIIVLLAFSITYFVSDALVEATSDPLF